MKRLRTARWSGQWLLQTRTGTPRCQSSTAVAAHETESIYNSSATSSSSTSSSSSNSTSSSSSSSSSASSATTSSSKPAPLPSPSPDRAARSAKLAALHARLALPKKIPLQTLARALITPSADANANFNNANLAFLGSTIINYHVFEHLVCRWPRLPMAILYESLRAFAGVEPLQQIARRWGVDAAAAPGEEVDPGLLQWRAAPEGQEATLSTRWGYVRAEAVRGPAWRRGISSRVVLDDDFGDTVHGMHDGLPTATAMTTQEMQHEQVQNEAFASLVQAVVGAIHAHCGREQAKAFVSSHILSRHFDPSSLFWFKLPTRELAMLCAREGFQPPIARLESETGRMSRTPVYVVGIYSGDDKLGEGAGASLDVARRKACMASLKAWYLYTPNNKVRVPSDMLEKGAKPWKAPYIDMGEII